jgi:hypothetical protein
VRHLAFACVAVVLVVSCSSKRQDAAPAPPASTVAAAPAPPKPPAAPTTCAADGDCVPLNCCVALSEESCIPKAGSNCDKFELDCKDNTGPRYACTCDKGACVGRYTMGSGGPAPLGIVGPDAGAYAAQASISSGDLPSSAVLAVIMKHGPDVRACHARAKKAAGLATFSWNVLKTGAVEKPTVIQSTGLDPKLMTCLTKKISSWRFPKGKGSTRVTYGFRFTKS